MRTFYISDLDGTLLNNHQKLSSYTVRVLNDMIRNGLCFTIATARSKVSALPLVEDLLLNYPLIFSNGQSIYDPQRNETIRELFIEPELTREVVDLYDAFHISPMIHTMSDGQSQLVYQTRYQSIGMQEYLASRKKLNDQRLTEVKQYHLLNKVNTATIVTIGEKEALDPVYSYLSENYPLEITYYSDVYSQYYWLEIMHIDATKGNAVSFIRQYCQADQIVCFGDNFNDLSMYAASDYCLAVENGVLSLKKAADRVIESNEHDGVAKYLETLFHQ